MRWRPLSGDRSWWYETDAGISMAYIVFVKAAGEYVPRLLAEQDISSQLPFADSLEQAMRTCEVAVVTQKLEGT